MPAFDNFSLWVNITIFVAAAVCVWLAGTRLERAVEFISEKTGIGSAFGGFVLLAAATSLPELATTITGGIIGNAALLTNNLLGGVMMQTAVLAVADGALRRGALTACSPSFELLLGGVSLVMLLGVTLVVMTMGDHVSIGGVGVGTAAILSVHLTLMYLNYRSRAHPRWKPTADGSEGEPVSSNADEEDKKDQGEKESKNDKEDKAKVQTLRAAWMVFAISSVVILIAGWAVMVSAEALTEQTGVAASFVGATFVAIATSLPELSTTVAAVRRGHNAMAVSNIFGSNLWDVSLLFIGDVFFRSGPLLGAAPKQAMFTASLGLVMTCVYLWGLLERRDRTVGRFGIDSVVVLILYGGGLAVLYQMG